MEFSTKGELIEKLGLIKHMEGGYFVETYRSPDTTQTDRRHWNEGVRCQATSIYYMQTDEQPVGYPNKNISSIIHCYSGGAPSLHRFFLPDGTVDEQVLGPDVTRGHRPQVICPGNTWKIDSLMPPGRGGGGRDEKWSYALWSEVVVPGWEEADHDIMEFYEFFEKFPQYEFVKMDVWDPKD